MTEVVILVTTMIGAYVVGRIQQADKRKIMKAERLDERLFEDYETVLRPYLILFRGENVRKTRDMVRSNREWAEEAIRLVQEPAYHDAMSRIALTAPAHVVRALSEFHEHFRNNHYAETPSSPAQKEVLDQFRTLIGDVRKGFGRRDKGDVVDNILRLFIQDYDEYRMIPEDTSPS